MHIFSIDDFAYILNMFILIVVSIFIILKFHTIGLIIGVILMICTLFSIAEYIKNTITVYKQTYRNRD